MKYTAFISYRHGGIDEIVGTQIQREIERYKIPSKIAKTIGKKTLGKVFRDADDLRSASDLSEIIRSGIEESEFLIVICTKRYKESVWCMEEVEHFIEVRGRKNIIVVLVEGEPYESFPDILTTIEQNGQKIHVEPLAVDVRANTEKEIKKNVTKEKLRFISQILDLDYDDLKQRQREHQKRRNIIMASIFILALSIFGGTVTYKNIQLNSAYNELDESMQKTLKGQSYYLSEYANEAIKNGDRTTAALLALKALPKDLANPDRPYVPSVIRSLTEALGVYDYSAGYQPDKILDFEKESYDTKVEISQDEKILLIEKYVMVAGNMLEGEVCVYQLQSHKMLCRFTTPVIDKNYNNSMSHTARLGSDSKTLFYLAPDGLKSVDIYSGKEKRIGKTGSQLVLSDKKDLLVVYDTENAKIYYYDTTGKERAVTSLKRNGKYSLYCVSPDDSIAVLSQDIKKKVGVLLTDTQTGKSLFLNKTESCSKISFINDHSICFIRQDTQMGRKHIVVCDLNSNSDDYLVDTDKNIPDIAISDYETCFFYNEKDLYEISNKTGKTRWTHTFSSEIVSIEANGRFFAVTLRNGQIIFFDSYKKQLINTVQGNGKAFYMLAIDKKNAVLSDYWGQNIRIYKKRNPDKKDIESLDLSKEVSEIPETWYTAISGGDNFLLGLQNGMDENVLTFSENPFAIKKKTSLDKMDYESFNNISVDLTNKKYVGVQDYAYGENAHFDVDTMKKTFSFDENSFYFYNEDKSKISITKKKTVTQYDAINGKIIKSFSIPLGYDRGAVIKDKQIYGSNRSICIQDKNGRVTLLRNAILYTLCEKKELLFYRNELGNKWYVYSLKDRKVVCKGKAGTYSCTILFDDGKYFMNDYNSVYDTTTWKKVLDLSEISTGVYGVSTSENNPYFVVWYQSGQVNSEGKNVGSNIAYLYSKDNTNEIVGVVPNYVATTADNKVIVYDGAKKLYKLPLYSAKELIVRAKNYTKDSKLTKNQKEKYHLYNKE